MKRSARDCQRARRQDMAHLGGSAYIVGRKSGACPNRRPPTSIFGYWVSTKIKLPLSTVFAKGELLFEICGDDTSGGDNSGRDSRKDDG